MVELREVMRRWATGVSIVTVEKDGHKHGATVSSLASVSVAPPMVTIALTKGTRTHHMIVETGIFGVTLLSQEQLQVSEQFAGKMTEEQDRFEGIGFHYLRDQIPVLDGAIAYLACRIVHQYEMPFSTLFLGEVLEAKLGEDKPPLVYLNRAYKRLED